MKTPKEPVLFITTCDGVEIKRWTENRRVYRDSNKAWVVVLKRREYCTPNEQGMLECVIAYKSVQPLLIFQ